MEVNNMTKPKIGFIGLGLMGSAMVERFQEKGYALVVMANHSRTNVDAAVSRGATEVFSAREVAENSDVVMLCMGTSEQVESRMRGDEGVIAGLKSGAIVIDFGTSLPESTRTLAAEVAVAGGDYLDAPLGRTPAHAKQGLLNIMTAGNEDAFKRVKPVLQEVGENVFYLGGSGAGHTIKLFNNFIAMTTANMVSEVFALSDVAKIPRQTVYDVLSVGPANSGIMDFIKAYAVDGNPDVLEFSIKNAAKDVGYYKKMAEDAGVTPAIAPSSLAALQAAIDNGQGEDLVPKMVDFYQTSFANSSDKK
ncbi:NAD(P)-dependent oxidoreductase [Cocleimonas flava]|nr:NAD(P)-dependent oxidoreductase [Cocleimonas flava]